MTDQFKRIWKVRIGELETEDLRIDFRVTQTLGKEPNTCDLKVTNLSEASRGKLKGARLPVVLQAGYKGQIENQSILFSGDTRTIDHIREKADWTTHVQCGDGERAYQYDRLSRSFGNNTPVVDVIKYAADGLSVNRGNLDEMLAQYPPVLPTFYFGYVAFGRAGDILSDLLSSCGLKHSVHNGALLVTSKVQGQGTVTTQVVLTPSTGLLGSPEHTPPDNKGKPGTLKFKCLLNARLRPSTLVRISSANIDDGVFVLQKVEHQGDSHGSDWVTSCEALKK
jgi:hypothetical protein